MPLHIADELLNNTCKGSDFCCEMRSDGKIQLKCNHVYYHQVQLQLYVASDLCSWCDFCAFTTKDIAVERIYPDAKWVNEFCPVLDNYF